MKKMKRWLALVLAIALVSTNAIYQLGTHMSASESSQDTSVSEEQPQQEEQAADSQTQDTTEHTDSGQASVQEVTPDQSATATTQQAADVQQAADAQQTEAAQKDVAKTIAVKIQKSDVDGGTVKVVNADGSKSDVTYDGNNQYAKEVTEGESFGFEVTAKDGYQVEQVTDQNGTAIQPASVNGNVSTYNITDIRSEKVFSVTYNKVETQTEESTDAETEEVQKPGVSEQDTDEENGIALMSISGPTSVEVGSTITLTSDRGGNYDKWSVSDDNKASITANANNSTSAVLTGKKAGNVTVTHSWYSRYLGYWYEQSETFDVTVTKKAMTRIYVYVKLNVAAGVSTSGWNINKDGWYTIGYVDVSSDSVPAADEKNLDRYYPEYSSAVQAALGNIHYYSGNQSVSQGIDLQGSNVNWSASGYGLKIASGASDYGNETGSTKQWHLDGLLTIKKIEKHNVTINYVYEDGSKAADSVIFKDVETGKSVSQTSPNIEGYTADQEKVTVTVLKDDVTVTVTYKKNYPKEKITIKAGSAEKVYDGTPLTEEKYTYTQGILLDGDVLTATTSGSRTEVGTSYNVIAGTAYSIKHGDKDVTSKYNVGLESGTLTVKPQSIVPENPDYKGIDIDIPSDSKYDGLEHKWSPTVKNAKGEKLTEGTDYEVSYDTDNFVDVKTITVTITGIGNYDGTVTRVYRITKAPLTIITKGATKVYDGEPLTEAKMTIKGLKNNEEVGHKTTGSQTVVGSSDNTYKLDWKEGTAKQGNYEIVKEQLGQLVVTETKDEIVVTTVGGEFTYDGKAHGASVTVEGLPKGYEVKTKKSNATATNVKDGTVKATADELVIVNKNGEDVTSKLTIKKVDGTIKINPAPVTVTTAGDEKVYDGTALTADGSITGLVNGEDKKVDFKVTGSQTEVGSSENSYTLDWKDVDSKNYNLKKNLGTLKVTEQSIDPGTEEEPNPSYKGITINDPKDKEYDGKKHQWSPTVKDASGNELTEGTDYEVSYDTNDFVDVKTIKVTITGKGNYAGTVTKVYSITKAPLIITTEGATKVYDGEPLTEAKMTIKGLKNNEEVGHKTTGSQTVVGSSDNTYKLDWKEGTAKQGNYEIVKEQLGQLVVTETKDEIVVTTVGGEFTYDGKAHGASVTVEGLPKGYEVKTKKSNATATNVKDGTVKATADELVIVNKNGEDVTSKLTIKKVDGTIKINPAPVTVTTAGDEKVYDGTALTADGSITGLVNGEDKKVDFKVTGSQTAVGNSENNYTLDWKDVDSKNYDLKENLGTLEVTPQSINPGPNPENPDPSYDGIQIDSPSDVEYDGLAHKWSPTVTDKNGNALTEGTDYEVSYDKKDFTDVKTITVTITGKGNYTGTVTRVYNILAAPLIIRTEKAEKTYDGKPLTNENMTIEGLKNGEVVVHKTTGSQTEVGNSDNTYELDWKSKETTAKESNYIIKEVSLGKLVVKETEDEIVVTTTGGTFTYDGQPHGATVEVSELPEGYTLQTAESDATATDVTTEAVTADADRLVIVNAAGVDVTANLKITRVTGEIVVNPATVTVTTPNASKVYDGTPLTAAGTITGLVNGETVSFATTGTITNVGTATNSYSLVWDQTAKETNYTVSENLGTLTVTAPTNNNPSVTPAPPATPNPPATPSDNPGVLDRVVDTIKDVAADVQEVFSSDDGDVPLANQNLDEHKCCILHFLIMLLTAILYGFFTHNMKKRQKKNFELREELDTELVKRGLPTSKEQKNS